MSSPTLQALQDPILLLPWVCFRGGFPNPSRTPAASFVREKSCAAATGGVPKLGWAVSRHTQHRLLTHPAHLASIPYTATLTGPLLVSCPHSSPLLSREDTRPHAALLSVVVWVLPPRRKMDDSL
jgi:hypothetical protein